MWKQLHKENDGNISHCALLCVYFGYNFPLCAHVAETRVTLCPKSFDGNHLLFTFENFCYILNRIACFSKL